MAKLAFFVIILSTFFLHSTFSQRISPRLSYLSEKTNAKLVSLHEHGKVSKENLANFIQSSLIPQTFSDLLKNETKLRIVLDGLQNEDEPPDSQCVNHVTLVLETLVQLLTNITAVLDPQYTWALHMIDSWGRFPTEGILAGHLNSYGDYDECVGVSVDGLKSGVDDDKVNSFDGQYCMLYMVPWSLLESSASDMDNQNDVIETRKAGTVIDLLNSMYRPLTTITVPSIATCIPSTCSAEDLQTVSFAIFGALFPNMAPLVGFCQVKEDTSLDSGAKAMIGVLGTILGIILIGSVLDIVLGSVQKEKFEDLSKKLPIRLLVSFSVPTNVRKWANTSSVDGGFGCIHGIRFLSTCWVLLSHTMFVFTMQGPTWNSIEVNNIYTQPWPFYIILNGYFSVDTFFTMSGLLACYTILKALDKTGGKLNVFKLYLHRYLRLTPTYAIIIGIMAHLLKYFGSGPYFTLTIQSIAENCKKFWWHNLLYFQNVYNYDSEKGEGMCEGESWYIANDMQFFILSPIFAFLLWKWRRIGMGVLGAASIASVLAPGIVVGTENLPPTQIFWKLFNPRSEDIYFHPWFRIGPYLVGMWMGYLLFRLGRKKVHLPKLVVLIGWMLSTATALTLIFGVKADYDPDHVTNSVAAGFYAGLSRFVWGLVIVWIIFACVQGHGGWINEFLCWKVFIPLGRLSFCVYVSSLSVQYMLQLTLRQPVVFDKYHVTNMFFSHVIMCFLVGFVLSMLFESPFIALEKVIFGPSSRPGPRQENLPQVNGGIIVKNDDESIPYKSSTIPRIKAIHDNS